MFVVLVNGPPRSGKDLFGDELVRELGSARKFKLATPIKEGTHASFGLKVPENYFEEIKDDPRHEFLGLTPRQAYINHSEKYMKPVYGQDVFGKLMANHLLHFMRKGRSFTYAVITDCGFEAEVQEIVKLVTAHKVLLLRIFRDGCDFSNDSRSYIDPYGPDRLDIKNGGTIYDWRAQAKGIAREISRRN